MEIQQRLELFFKRLMDAAPAASAEEALALVCRLMEEVEEELCPVPKQTPAPTDFTGRMYPPQADRIRLMEGGILRANTRHHRIFCRPSGAIDIWHVPSKKHILSKTGKR
jgi:hypothetical protein